MTSTDFKVSGDGRAVVSTVYALRPIDRSTPREQLIILYSQHGVSRVGTLKKGEEALFHGWAPLPYAPKDLKEKHEWINQK